MSENKQPLTVAVTGLNAIDSPGPGVAVIRALRDGLPKPLRIIGLSYETLEPGIYMHDVVDKTYQITYPAAGTEALLNRIKYIHEKDFKHKQNQHFRQSDNPTAANLLKYSCTNFRLL